MIPSVLSRCHTKIRLGARGRAHPFCFGMTSTSYVYFFLVLFFKFSL